MLMGAVCVWSRIVILSRLAKSIKHYMLDITKQQQRKQRVWMTRSRIQNLTNPFHTMGGYVTLQSLRTFVFLIGPFPIMAVTF